MPIREFEHTDPDYEALAHVINTVWPERAYTVSDLKGEDNERPPTLIHHRFMAEMDGRVVGCGAFANEGKFYHPQRFWMSLDVLPDARQQGIGTRLYDHMLAMLQSTYHATELHTATLESRADSLRFLNNRGFQESQRDPMSRLEVANFDPARFRGLDAQIAAAGIEIKVLSDLIREDANVLHKVYELHQALVNDVPEPAEHTKADFELWLDGYSSNNPYFIADANFMAVHGTNLIGLSSLWGKLSDDTLYAGLTGVLPPYRQKGIATALKLRAAAYAQAQNTRLIMTSNNSQNPMYRLNLSLGFQTYEMLIKFVKPMSP
jgi:GNAT superfamily N-acetyltransferase